MSDETRYERQILLEGIGEQGQKKIEQAKVLIIGVGGLGSPCAMYLAGAGVGVLGLVDADIVSESNLHRQVLYYETDIGQSKVECAKKHLQDRNSNVKIKTYAYRLTEENAAEIIKDYDFVIDAVDNFETKFLINDICVSMGKAFCHGGIVGYYGQVMTYVKDQGPCYRCIFEEVPTGEDVPSCKVSGVLGPAVGVLGCVQATEAIKYIAGVGELLVGRMFTVDTRTLISRTVNIGQAVDGCLACDKSI